MQHDLSREMNSKRTYSNVDRPILLNVKFTLNGKHQQNLTYTPSIQRRTKKPRLDSTYSKSSINDHPSIISTTLLHSNHQDQCSHHHIPPQLIQNVLPLVVHDVARNYCDSCLHAINGKTLSSFDRQIQCNQLRRAKLDQSSICISVTDIVQKHSNSPSFPTPSLINPDVLNSSSQHLTALSSLESLFHPEYQSSSALFKAFAAQSSASSMDIESLVSHFPPRELFRFRSRLEVIGCLLHRKPIPVSMYQNAQFPSPTDDQIKNKLLHSKHQHSIITPDTNSDLAVLPINSLHGEIQHRIKCLSQLARIQYQLSTVSHSIHTENNAASRLYLEAESMVANDTPISACSIMSSHEQLRDHQQFVVVAQQNNPLNFPSTKLLGITKPVARLKTSSELLSEMPSHVLPETLIRKQHSRDNPAVQPPPQVDNRRALVEAQSLRETERLRRKAAKELLEQKKSVRKFFLTTLKSHRDEFLTFHKNRVKAQSTLVKACARNQEWAEKRRRAAEERARKDRMKALKENDMTAYAELLREHKNDRLQHVLNQTDQHMKQLRALIRNEQSIDRSTVNITSRKPKRHNMSENLSLGDTVQETVQSTESASDNPSFSLAENAPLDGVVLSDDDDAFGLSLHVPRQVDQPALLTGCTLKDYQLVGLSWLVRLHDSHLNGILADEMGLGKTVQAIALFAYLIESRGNQGPFMVVCPLSTLQNWADELARFAPDIRAIVYHGSKQQRASIFNHSVNRGDFNVLLTTFECVINKTDRPRLSSITWQYICIDEGHRIKNSESKLSATLTGKYQSVHRLILSGTPLQNSLRELWSLLNWLLPTIFNSGEHFEEWFNAPFNATGIDNTELEEEEKLLIIHRLHSVLRPFVLRRLKSEVAEQLPAKVEIVIKCELSAWQRAMYEQITNKALASCDSKGTFKLATCANTIMQLRKCCNHPYLFSDQLGWRSSESVQNSSSAATNVDAHASHDITLDIVRSSGKFALLHRMLPKLFRTGHRVLVFCQMTRVMDLLEDYLEWRSIPFLRLDGSVASVDRKNALADFNAPNSPYNIFLLSTRAGGLGLNLQTADTVVLFDSDYNPQQDAQAQDRAHRIGQTKQVRVFRLITMSPVEEEILKRARFKLGLDQIVIQSGKFDTQSSADERRSLLQAVLREGVKHGSETRAPSDSEINEMIARSSEEIEIFNQMDRELDDIDAQLWRGTNHVNGTPPSRLMGDDELPDFLLASAELVKAAEIDDTIDLDKRARRSVPMTYSEDLSDEQFFEILEDEEDIFELTARLSEQNATSDSLNSKTSNGNNDEDPATGVSIRNGAAIQVSSTPSDSDDELLIESVIKRTMTSTTHDSEDDFLVVSSSEEESSDSVSEDDDWESPKKKRRTRTR